MVRHFANPNSSFWRNKRVLLTGHTGFKGAWLTIWLRELGAQVTGVSLPPETEPSLFKLADIERICQSIFCDLRDQNRIAEIVKSVKPDVVLHLAAQPLVLEGYRDPIKTFATNVMGTAHLLEAVRGVDSVKALVMVTTDKVYRNNEWLWPYRETDALGGHDPYSASKAASELIINSYASSYLSEKGVAVATARAGNVIGGGDWAVDRLIPDAIRAWQSGEQLEIRRPHAVRPWQHVLEPLCSYLLLCEAISRDVKACGAYNFGPQSDDAVSVKHVIDLAQIAFKGGKVAYSEQDTGPHEAKWLALDTSKARMMLGVQPRWGLDESVERTVSWYLKQQGGAPAFELCLNDIGDFSAKRSAKSLGQV